MTELTSEVEALRRMAFKLSCHDQFRLASFIAENVGYVLAPEPGFNDEPTLADRVERLEKIVENMPKGDDGDCTTGPVL